MSTLREHIEDRLEFRINTGPVLFDVSMVASDEHAIQAAVDEIQEQEDERFVAELPAMLSKVRREDLRKANKRMKQKRARCK